MGELFAEPLTVALVAATLAVLVGLRTPWARWAALGALGVVVLAIVGACFDGRPHVNAKFDATTLVWAGVLVRRAVSGAVLVVLALPVSRAVAEWGAVRPWWLAGSALGFVPGAALLGSSVLLQTTLQRIVADTRTSSTDKLRALAHAIHLSHAMLVGAALGALVAGLWLARRLCATPAPGDGAEQEPSA
jgi:hypothetical protein